MEVYGYETKTTFWSDFSIADQFGIDAIRDTYKRAFEEWKSNAEYLTELVLVLNWKMWDWRNKKEYMNTYLDLWEQADRYALDNLKGEDLKYFLETTD